MNSRRLILAALLLSIPTLFALANRGAYRSFFQADDLDNLSWTTRLSGTSYLQAVASPFFSRKNFRPVGHAFYKIVESRSGLYFPAYVGTVQVLHLLNGVLVFFLARKVFGSDIAGLTAFAFFLFNRATFDAYWKPMYVFDVLCATFVLACCLLYLKRQFVASLVCLWLAMKAKEMAVLLPVALLAYEMWLGERRWKRVLPFLAVTAWFGAQALFANANVEVKDAYTLRFSRAFFTDTTTFYLRAVFGSALAGLGFAALAAYPNAWRLRWAILSGFVIIFPVLLLPYRKFAVYAYVPLIFWAMGIGALTTLTRAARIAVPALLAVAWVPWTFAAMREYRKAELTYAADNRQYVDRIREVLRTSPGTPAFVYDGLPHSFEFWGVSGAVHYLSRNPDARVESIDAPGTKALLSSDNVAVLSWDADLRKLAVVARDPRQRYQPYISVSAGTPVWQLGSGWYPREGSFRWTAPHAEATMLRPASARVFEVVVNAGSTQIETLRTFRIALRCDGEMIGEAVLSRAGVQTFRFPVEPSQEKTVAITFDVSPALRLSGDAREYGAALVAWGYKNQ